MELSDILSKLAMFLADPIGLQLIFFILTIIASIFTGIIVNSTTRQRRRPNWFFDGEAVYDKGILPVGDLKMSYKDEDVDKLSAVSFSFWNAGKQAIRREDVVEEIKIRVPEDCVIYHAEVINQTKESNGVEIRIGGLNNTPESRKNTEDVMNSAVDEKSTVTDGEEKSRNSINVSFNYLDCKQGFRLLLLTDCMNVKDICLEGEILECKALFDEKKSRRHYFRNLQQMIPIILGVFVCVLFAIIWALGIDYKGVEIEENVVESVFFLVVGIVVNIIFIRLYVRMMTLAFYYGSIPWKLHSLVEEDIARKYGRHYFVR